MIAAVIPLKRLANAKSRLSHALSPEERMQLVRHVLQRTVDALAGSTLVDVTVLATAERELAQQMGLTALPDAGNLNDSLQGAMKWACTVGANALLILPADLPLIAVDDICDLIEGGAPWTGMTIAPTRDGGTGALLLRPPDAIPPAFGPGSFQRHVQLAEQHGLHVRTVMRQAFAFDLDTVEDLESLRAYLPRVG